MAREVAVDVASHSPHVDPILVELAEVLAELAPRTPTVPFYSATLEDPRALPACDAQYWVDNLRQSGPVRRGGPGGARRRFPGVRRTVPAPAADARRRADREGRQMLRCMPIPACGGATGAAARAARLRRRPVQRGRRSRFLGPVPAGAAARRAAADVDPTASCSSAPVTATPRSRARLTVAVHPLLGEHVRLPEEPERHAWQADVGTGEMPWLADHKVNNVAAYPGAAYCEMALAAAEPCSARPHRWCRPGHPVRAVDAAR